MDDFLILDLDDDGFAGADIGDGIGEEVWPFLFEQGGLLAFGFGLFVDGFGLLFLLDHAFDEAVTDLHAERVDGAFVGQGEDVDAFDPAVGRVLETLGDAGAGDGAGNVDLHIRQQRRGLNVFSGRGGLEEQRATGGIIRRDEAGLLIGPGGASGKCRRRQGRAEPLT